MLCSVLYKRWTRGRTSGQQVNDEVEGDDYDDAIQRAAPPAYDKGTFTFEIFRNDLFLYGKVIGASH